MNQQKLPNATTSLVLGIISIIFLCCFGPVSLVLGGIGFYLARKDEALYKANPSAYTNVQNSKAGKILSLIGLILGALSTIYAIYIFSTLGVEGYQQMIQDAMDKARAGQ